MKKITFPKSALEIMQACLEYYKESSTIAKSYLDMIESVISGKTIILSSSDFLEIHRFVISIYSSIIEKGKLTNDKWTDSQWKKVLEYIESYYSKDETYEVTRRA